MDRHLLQYLPFTSLVDPSFWHLLIHKKIHEYKLNQDPKSIFGSYHIDGADNLPALISLDYQSFSEPCQKSNSFPFYGTAFIFNTIEEFKELDKKEFLNQQGQKLWNELISKSIDEIDLNKTLCSFILLTFADIKKYKCYYWFAFPAFSSYPENVYIQGQLRPLESELNEPQIELLYHKLTTSEDRCFFLICCQPDQSITLHSLCELESVRKMYERVYVSFADPSKNDLHPGWPLRNLIALLAAKFQDSVYQIIACRIRKGSAKASRILEVEIDRTLDENVLTAKSFQQVECVGYEKNSKNKLLPRIVDLSSSMDPKKLAENAIDLNLKLMKWRLMPNLDLEKLTNTKCLLLGSGTLGCNVARCLMGWGVHSITLLDNGVVSYSNPSRQSLFEFADCTHQGRNKSEAAAEALKRIHPSLNVKAEILSVPMPGHSISAELVEQNRKDCERLSQLIDEHDCVFLLMDTRESRWLPTFLAHYKRKLCINAALGFDTYLVQRHGFQADDNNEPCLDEPIITSGDYDKKTFGRNVPGSKLGCYFCNDVVAPGDSTRNRTLDQQCTVTRPGVSMIAAALAVELMVSVVQHVNTKNAPAWIPIGRAAASLQQQKGNVEPQNYLDDEPDSLGIIPHQIRGFLSHFNQVLPACLAFSQCTACSAPVAEAYERDGYDFLLKVFNRTDYLEEITGLKLLHQQINFDDVWAISDEEEEDEEKNQ